MLTAEQQRKGDDLTVLELEASRRIARTYKVDSEVLHTVFFLVFFIVTMQSQEK